MRKHVYKSNLDDYRVYPEEEIDEFLLKLRAYFAFFDAVMAVDLSKIPGLPDHLGKGQGPLWEELVPDRLMNSISTGAKLSTSERAYLARLVKEDCERRKSERRRGRPSMSPHELAMRDCRISDSVKEYRKQVPSRDEAIEATARSLGVSKSEVVKALARWSRLEKQINENSPRIPGSNGTLPEELYDLMRLLAPPPEGWNQE